MMQQHLYTEDSSNKEDVMKKSKKLVSIICILTLTITLFCPGLAMASEDAQAEPETGSSEISEPVNPVEEEQTEPTSPETEVDIVAEENTEDQEELVEEPQYQDPIAAMGYYGVTNYGNYRGKNAKRIPIITYHMLCSPAEKAQPAQRNNDLFVSADVFDAQMRWLKAKGYRTISTEEFAKWRFGKMRLPKKSVLITFDDGKYCAIKYGVPILAKYGFKATMFVIGSKVGNTTNIVPNAPLESTYIGRDKMGEVRSKYPNLEFQGHSWNLHYRAKGRKGAAKVLPWRTQRDDLLTQIRVFGYRFLAYPFGSYNKNTIKACKKAGIRMAFTYGSNGWAKRGQNKYKIKRIKISGNQSMNRFYKWFYK